VKRIEQLRKTEADVAATEADNKLHIDCSIDITLTNK